MRSGSRRFPCGPGPWPCGNWTCSSANDALRLAPGLVRFPLGFEHSRVLTGGVKFEAEVLGRNLAVRLGLHIAPVQEVRIPMVVAQKLFAQGIEGWRLHEHGVQPDGARKDGNIVQYAPPGELLFHGRRRTGREQAGKTSTEWLRVS